MRPRICSSILLRLIICTNSLLIAGFLTECVPVLRVTGHLPRSLTHIRTALLLLLERPVQLIACLLFTNHRSCLSKLLNKVCLRVILLNVRILVVIHMGRCGAPDYDFLNPKTALSSWVFLGACQRAGHRFGVELRIARQRRLLGKQGLWWILLRLGEI